MPEPLTPITLRDQEDITNAEYARACGIATTLRSLISAQNETHPEVSTCDAFSQKSEDWRDPSGKSKFGELVSVGDVLDPSYSMVNQLRIHCTFTGYSLMNVLQPGTKPSWTDVIGQDVEPEFMEGAPDWAVGAFRRLSRDLPSHLIPKPQAKLGEVGWLVDGTLVNRDVVAYLERVALMHGCGLLDELATRKKVRILEIGGGYGGLAQHLSKVLPNAEYYICDLPLSLFFSATYLTLLAQNPDKVHLYTGGGSEALIRNDTGFTLVPNHLFPDLRSQTFDLAINTLSFAEMPAQVVESYAEGLAAMLGEDGVLFEQNFDCDHYGLPSFCDPSPILKRHFGDRQSISEFNRWGRASVWSNGRTASRAWKPVETSVFHPSPLLVEVGYQGFNLVMYQHECIGLAQSLGPVDLASMDPSLRSSLKGHGHLFTGVSPQDVRDQIDGLTK
jgi:hypothetical protein